MTHKKSRLIKLQIDMMQMVVKLKAENDPDRNNKMIDGYPHHV